MAEPTFIAGSWGQGGLDLARIQSVDAKVLDTFHCPVPLAEAKGRHSEILEQDCADWLEGGPKAPIILSGMVGGRGNWVETEYTRCPVGIEDLARASEQLSVADRPVAIVSGASADRPVAIVSGASILREGLEADVMRGEEVQILGALAIAEATSATFCIPGTNAKWASADACQLIDFASYITGDLYDHLRNRSMVGALATGDAFDETAFRQGLTCMQERGLSNAAFTARSAVLLNRLEPRDVASYLSGVVIGSEICDSARFRGDAPVLLIAGGASAMRYGHALDHHGIAYTAIDALQARLAGLAAVGRAIWD